jgi:hypothetical protein
MPEREDLHLLAPISTHQQEKELKDVAEDEVEDEVEEGPEHKQPGWPLSHRAHAINRRSAVRTRFPHPTGYAWSAAIRDLTVALQARSVT